MLIVEFTMEALAQLSLFSCLEACLMFAEGGIVMEDDWDVGFKSKGNTKS